MKTLLETIGCTPVVPFRKMSPDGAAEVWAKLEGFNPGASVKDRIAFSMIESGEECGLLKPGGLIIEPTSGNTGIGLALVACLKGYRLILTMPESMSLERRQLLSAYGAELVLTPGPEGMGGAVRGAEALMEEHPDAYMPQQFRNPANPDIHRRTTALEILHDFGTDVDAFVAGIGTGGTITGVGEVLKEKNSSTKVIAVEPDASPVLSGGKPGPHKIAGIGANFVPEILNTSIYDEIVRVPDDDAAETTRRLALEEGLFVGISSGAAAWAALRVAERLGKGKRVVVVLPDRGERYLSTGLFSAD